MIATANFRKKLLQVGLGAVLLPLTAIHAPSAAAAIEEIVVTAQKREQAITDVGATVQAYQGDTLRENGIDTPSKVAFLVPNVDIKGTQGNVNPAITVRGVGQNNFNSNNNPSVGVYVDEVFLSSPGLIGLAMFDVERIEVLKGPQGTLYGRNASGGALNIHTAKPTPDTDGFVQISAGDYETVKVEGAIGGSLGENLAGRVSLLVDEQGENFHDYLRDSGGTANFNDSSTLGLRGQLGNVGDQVAWNLSVSHLDQDLGNLPFSFLGGTYDAASGPYSFVPCAVPLAPTCSDVAGFQGAPGIDTFTHSFQNDQVSNLKIDSEITGATFNVEVDLDSMVFTSITGYMEQDRVYGENFWPGPNELFAVVHDEEIEQLSQEFRLNGGNERINWVVGAFFSLDEFDAVNTVDTADFGALLVESDPLFWDIDQETQAWAVNASIDWMLSEQFTLTTGIRYTDEETDFAGGTRGTAVVDNALGIPGLLAGDEIPFTFIDDTFSDDQVDFRVALEYRPNDDQLFYGSYSTGFKSGGFFGDFTLDNGELAPFDSETLGAVELGWKGTLAEGRVQLNVAAFVYDYEDIQTFVPASFGFKLDNIDGADIYGLDAELIARPTDSFELRAGLGILDTETDSSEPGLDGNELPNAGELQWTLGGRYELAVGRDLRLAFQADAKYTDEMFREATNNALTVTDDYTLVNARVTLLPADDRWSVSLYAFNLTDEEYFQEAFFSDLLGSVVGLAGSPRVWGASFTYNIGQ